MVLVSDLIHSFHEVTNLFSLRDARSANESVLRAERETVKEVWTRAHLVAGLVLMTADFGDQEALP